MHLEVAFVSVREDVFRRYGARTVPVRCGMADAIGGGGIC